MKEPTRWEYKIETFGTAFKRPKDTEIEDILNAWGADGWETFQVIQPQGSNKITLVAKRRYTGHPRRKAEFSQSDWGDFDEDSFN